MCSTTVPARRSLPVDLSSARLARRFLEQHWCHAHESAHLDQAHLLVTELVTNAVRHGEPPIEVEVNCTGPDGVVLSVSDGSPARPRQQDATLEGTGGRGVALVDVVSADWGVRPHRADGDGAAADAFAKTVWCRLVA